MSPSTTWLSDLKDGGTFLLNCHWTAEELDEHAARRHEARSGQEERSSSTTSTPSSIAAKVGMGNRINTIMQAAFFKLAERDPL